MSGNRRKLIPIALALAGAAGVAGATFFFSQGSDETPSAEKIAPNAIPPVTASAPAAVAPQEMPEIPAPSASQTVAMTAPMPAAMPADASVPRPMQLNAAFALAQTDPVAARLALTQLLDRREVTLAEMPATMAALRDLNATLFFSPIACAGDPTICSYTVQPGDTLSKIAKKNAVQTDWRVIQRINGMKSEKSLRVGQKIKLPVGAFHAEVSKSNYEMRIYAGEGPTRVLIAAYSVGLGELNSTPTGAFMVRPKSKLINPEWKNPRTGESFAPDDPKNPIGERWIGLIGVEAHNQGFKGYGIHGTIDQASIGAQASMGCLRMRDSDVSLVYELLTEPNSTIVIAP